MSLHLDLAYRHPGPDSAAFQLELSAELDGPVTGVFGPSGAGKSTVLNLIAGLLRPDRGSIRLDDDVLFDAARGIHLPPHARRVGVVFQDARLFPHLSVRGNLGFGERLTPRSQRRFQRTEIVELLELGALLERRPAELSGGERQRAALGRALLASPRLLLLDEPLASLDAGRKSQILPFFQRVRDSLDLPLVYVSHDLTEILQLTEDLILLEGGRALASGRYRDICLTNDAAARALPGALVNVIETVVRRHDASVGCTFVEPLAPTRPCTLALPQGGWPEGTHLFVSARPGDIALATQRIEGISVQNQLVGRIERFVRHDGQLLLGIDVGVPLLVELSQGSFDRLKLEIGGEVHCLIKSNALVPLRS